MRIVALISILWVLKSGTYWMVFRQRNITATVMDCLIIGGAPLLIAPVGILLPYYLVIPVSIGLAVYLTMHYTGVNFLPDGLFVPLGIEVVYQTATWAVQELGVV